jgi:methyltransferase-like protein
VPQSVREAILRISGEMLSKDGIAYISYNVLPGWRRRQIIRDAFLLNVPSEASPKDQVAKARVILNTMKEQTEENTADGKIWRTEAEFLATKRDDYILHEFLEQTNEPCSFSEFAAAAGRYGLAYLAEVALKAMIPENISPNAGEAIRRISGNKLISGEQNVDIVTGRTFRQTMLVHESRAASIQRLLTPASLKGLHLVAQINCREITDTKPGEWVFDGTNDRRFTTTSPVVAEALRHLMGRLPSTTAVNDLIKINPATTANENSVLDALFKIVLVGSAAPVSEAIDGMAALTERPIVSAIAAVDAASGAASTVTPRHEVVSLDVVSHVIFPLLDGTRDRDALVAELFHQAELGKITFQKDNMRVTDETVVRLGCAEHIDRVLAIAARSGLLT